MKRRLFERYIPEVARSLNILTGKNAESIKKKLEELAIKKVMSDEHSHNVTEGGSDKEA